MSSCVLFLDDEESRGKINIDDLFDKKKNRDLKQLSIFNKILNRIHKRIMTTGKSKSNDRHIWFNVPEYLFGEPCYTNSDCVAYLITQLKANGFSIRYIHPNTLFISWDHYVPLYVRTEIKKKTGVVVNSRGEKVNNSEEGGGGDDDDDENERGGGGGGGDRHGTRNSAGGGDDFNSAILNRKHIHHHHQQQHAKSRSGGGARRTDTYRPTGGGGGGGGGGGIYADEYFRDIENKIGGSNG